ncbi:MAG: NADH-quinone oxidoreductase subunit C [candidate division Zixibacteria bacterium]|nr:NADH-quinone oxidoreductase subunit C [candidate division Zixibacteria bacterium]
MEDKLRRFLTAAFPDALVRETNFRNELSFYIKSEALPSICETLMNDPELTVNFLADITSVDWLNHPRGIEGRFEVIYNLYSLKHKYRFFLKVHLPEAKPAIASLTSLWNGANWMEREVWDMMGIVFIGHPELTKILTTDELEGHPLRRDFPLTYEVPHFSWNKNNPPEVIK